MWDWVIVPVSSGLWLSPVAIFISAIIARHVALSSIEKQREIQAKKATLDLIAAQEVDREFIEAKSDFNEQRDKPSGFKRFAEDPPSGKILANVRLVLNRYELIAVGIEQGILDEAFYKSWFQNSLLKDYRASLVLISDIRDKENNRVIYTKFERLAKKWNQD